jgi:hypothetical protein
MKISNTAHNRRFGNMAGRRILSQLFVRYQQQSGLDFYYLAFVVIFIISIYSAAVPLWAFFKYRHIAKP